MSVETLFKLSNILDVTTDYLLKDSKHETQDKSINEVLASVKNLQYKELELLIFDVIKTIFRHTSKK